MTTQIPIYTWTDAYVAIRQRAEERRGSITINPNTLDWERWPRTTGTDVIAIAAVIDPFVRSLPAEVGHLAIARRWAAFLAELERTALANPSVMYAGNRAFWRTLAAVAVHLASTEIAMPARRTWDALLAQLGAIEPRNVGPSGDVPFGPFTGVKTYDDLYNEQFKLLRDRRGADQMDPEPGMMGARSPIPRTTNADVILLADYWGQRILNARQVEGHRTVKQRWDAANADVNTKARGAEPTALYPNNNGFWRALEKVANQVAVADEAPTDWDRFTSAVEHSITHLPENVAAAANYVASGAGHAASAVSSAAGKVAGAAASGFLGSLKTPLLVGAGLVGAYLLLRKSDDKTPAPTSEG
jgi:hypothetical protein